MSNRKPVSTMSSSSSAKSPAPPTPRNSTASNHLNYSISTPSRLIYPQPVQPPLEPLSYQNRPYPTTSSVTCDTSAFKALRQSDMEAADLTVQMMRQANHSLRADLTNVLTELSDAKKKAQMEAAVAGDEAKALSKSLEREREEILESERRKEEVSGTKRSVQLRFESCAADVMEAKATLESKRAKKTQQRLELKRQAALNGPELALFEEKVGLKMKGRGRDLVQFKFMNVDSGSFVRTFAFDVDVSQPLYSIPTISPPNFLHPQTIAPILNELNQSRDFNLCIRAMRRAFVNEVAMEKTGEKERREKNSGLGVTAGMGMDRKKSMA